MSQVTDVMNSTLWAILIDGTQIGYLTDVNFDLSHSPREKTNKDSNGWQEFLEGIKGATGQATFFYAEDAAHGTDEIWTHFNSRTQAAFIAGHNVTGNTVMSGNCYISGLNHSSAGQEDNVGVSVSVQVTGAVARAVVS